MIAVTMMDSEEMGGGLIELTGAAGADKTEHTEGFLPVVGVVIKCGSHAAQLLGNFCFSRQFDAGRAARPHFTTGIFSVSEALLTLPSLLTFS